jgi:uncharacterized protein YegP (UPF0339 family)
VKCDRSFFPALIREFLSEEEFTPLRNDAKALGQRIGKLINYLENYQKLPGNVERNTIKGPNSEKITGVTRQPNDIATNGPTHNRKTRNRTTRNRTTRNRTTRNRTTRNRTTRNRTTRNPKTFKLPNGSFRSFYLSVHHQNLYTTMATFELYTDKAGEFRFRLKAGNGENILASEGYKAKASATNGIESVKKNASDDANYECKSTNAGHSFNLLAGNKQVIGTSQVYSSESSRDNGIESVKKNAPGAEVKEV